MCPANSPSHSDMNQHCQVSNDLISFAHRAVLNPKVSSFVALYSTFFQKTQGLLLEELLNFGKKILFQRVYFEFWTILS